MMISSIIDTVLYSEGVSTDIDFEHAYGLITKVLTIRRFQYLHRNIKIAMSIVIVGCLRSEFFGDVFKAMR